LRAVLAALQAAVSAARRRPQASASRILDTAPSGHMAKTTKTRVVYEDVYEYQRRLRRPPPQPLLNNRNNLTTTLHPS
jgi:hypothetical protein